MRETRGDLWTYTEPGRTVLARVITTNGFVKKNGEAVMGRGVAEQAALRFPWLPSQLGTLLSLEGNRLFAFPPGPGHGYWLITFPVKPVVAKGGMPGWLAVADPKIIEESARQLLSWRGKAPSRGVIVMPRAGCGAGRLEWDDVKPILADWLRSPDFVVVNNDA